MNEGGLNAISTDPRASFFLRFRRFQQSSDTTDAEQEQKTSRKNKIRKQRKNSTILFLQRSRRLSTWPSPPLKEIILRKFFLVSIQRRLPLLFAALTTLSFTRRSSCSSDSRRFLWCYRTHSSHSFIVSSFPDLGGGILTEEKSKSLKRLQLHWIEIWNQPRMGIENDQEIHEKISTQPSTEHKFDKLNKY